MADERDSRSSLPVQYTLFTETKKEGCFSNLMHSFIGIGGHVMIVLDRVYLCTQCTHLSKLTKMAWITKKNGKYLRRLIF